MKQLRSFWSATFLIISLSAVYVSCMPESEIISEDTTLGLLVSRDTVIFDTIFSSVGSTTRRLKILNFNENAIVLDRIGLGLGEDSPYRVVINGEERSSLENEFIRGGDSLLVLVEVTIDPQDQSLPFIVRDSLVLEWNGQQAHVKLLAWGQDANFVGNEVLSCNTVWRANRPYVVYDDVLVDSGCTLTVRAGTQVYFDAGVTMLIGGSIQVEGEPDNKVVFQHSRLEPEFDDVPGQWGGFLFGTSSRNNVIEHAHIRNAVNGLYLGIPDADTLPELIVGHSIIESMSSNGLIAFTTDVYVYNTQINNCFQFAVANLAGGNYGYDHVTIANFNNVQREVPAVLFADNVVLGDNQLLVEPLSVSLRNSIIWGSEEEEVLLDNGGGAPFQVVGHSSIIKSLEESFPGERLLFNVDPAFVDDFLYDLRLDSLSPAVDRGLPLSIEDDLLGNPRLVVPDLGAYERN
ncbi:MAG: hypothetical protein AAFQ98_04960 [Bacteroidota bacterium]